MAPNISIVASFASNDLCKNVPLGFRFVLCIFKADISPSSTFAGTLIHKQDVFCQHEGVPHRSMLCKRCLAHTRPLLREASAMGPFREGIVQQPDSGALGVKRCRPPLHIRKRPVQTRARRGYKGSFLKLLTWKSSYVYSATSLPRKKTSPPLSSWR